MSSEELKTFLAGWLAEVDEFSLKSLHHRLVKNGVCKEGTSRRELSRILMELEDEEVLSLIRVDDFDEDDPFRDSPIWTAFKND